MNSIFDYVSRRKIIYPFFVIVVLIVILSLIFLTFFSSPLYIFESTISASGEKIIVNLGVENVSNHVVRDVVITVVGGDVKKIEKLKSQNNFLNPKEKYVAILEIPITDVVEYNIFVESPLSRAIKINFEVEESTLKPVKAEVIMPSKLMLGQNHEVIYKLFNVSRNNLFEVNWIEVVDKEYFEGEYFLKSVPIGVDECINLYSTLTPIKSGNTKISFLLKIGGIEQKLSKEVEIVNVS